MSQPEALAYQAHPAITRDVFVDEPRAHRAADQIAQGSYRNTETGKMCAVGCGMSVVRRLVDPRASYGDHAALAHATGVPKILLTLEDRIFEGLAVADMAVGPAPPRPSATPTPAGIRGKACRRVAARPNFFTRFFNVFRAAPNATEGAPQHPLKTPPYRTARETDGLWPPDPIEAAYWRQKIAASLQAFKAGSRSMGSADATDASTGAPQAETSHFYVEGSARDPRGLSIPSDPARWPTLEDPDADALYRWQHLATIHLGLPAIRKLASLGLILVPLDTWNRAMAVLQPNLVQTERSDGAAITGDEAGPARWQRRIEAAMKAFTGAPWPPTLAVRAESPASPADPGQVPPLLSSGTQQ